MRIAYAYAHAERAGEGWRITRGMSGSAYQTTWLPDWKQR